MPAWSDASEIVGQRPNIILILTDDQGYGDISAHGNPILQTPGLDRLHRESFRLVDFHVSPTCAPTRSALMTGRHEFKNGVTHTIMERERLRLDAITLAQVLNSAGYATGIFGKWHLGDEPEYAPVRRGFDEQFIHGGGGIGQCYPGSCGDAPGNTYFDPFILHNDQFVKTSGFCTDLFFQQATRWIDQQRQTGKPFFAYISTNAPHAPYTAKPEDAALYESKVDQQLAHFYGMIHNIDQNVDGLLNQIDQWGIQNNTLIIFMNDNGSSSGHKTFNAGMRGGKATAWLGGTRSSCFWRWTSTLSPGDCSALTAHIDLLPTLAEIAGAQLSSIAKQQIEGRSLVSLLQDSTTNWPDRYLFTHLGRWPKGEDPQQYKYKMVAVRNARYSLVSPDGGARPNWQLFDLASDYGQLVNCAQQYPAIVKELSSAFDGWWSDCQSGLVNESAMGPRINPFAERYYQQFGGQPSAQQLERMDPTRRLP